jgi:hypothetical protein
VVQASRQLLALQGFRLVRIQQWDARRAGSDEEVLDSYVVDLWHPRRDVLPMEFKRDEREELTEGQERSINEWGAGVGQVWAAEQALAFALEWRAGRL